MTVTSVASLTSLPALTGSYICVVLKRVLKHVSTCSQVQHEWMHNIWVPYYLSDHQGVCQQFERFRWMVSQSLEYLTQGYAVETEINVQLIRRRLLTKNKSTVF